MKENLEKRDMITTYTGIKFDAINPHEELIDIRDIAHALSLMCRANGHCLFFYSVAQHSINCAIEAKARGFSKKVQLACLVHDGSEAYMADIVRPYKKHLDKYLYFEDKLQNIIWNKYCKNGLSKEEVKQVFEIDDIVLYNEFHETMRVNTIEENEDCIGDVEFIFCDMKTIENKFLDLFEELSN